MCHGNHHQFNRCHGQQQINCCHGGPHQHTTRCHGEPRHHQPVRHAGCCCSSGDLKRQFYSKQEQLNKLEEYLQDLKLETRAVEEKIKKLKGEA